MYNKEKKLYYILDKSYYKERNYKRIIKKEIGNGYTLFLSLWYVFKNNFYPKCNQFLKGRGAVGRLRF